MVGLDYITPDGIVYPLHNSYDRFVLSHSGFGLPTPEYIDQRFGYGMELLDYNYEQRILQVVHRRECETYQDVWDAKREIINVFRVNRRDQGHIISAGRLRFRLRNGTTRVIDVVPYSGGELQATSGRAWDEYSFVETLRFATQGLPYFYDETPTIISQEIETQDALVFPAYLPQQWWFGNGGIEFTTDIEYLGDVATQPIITVNGPLDYLYVLNITTGVWFGFVKGVSLYETITIDCRFGNKAVTNQFGVSFMGSIENHGGFANFNIEPDPVAPNGLNQIYIAGSNGLDGETALKFQYRTNYLGGA